MPVCVYIHTVYQYECILRFLYIVSAVWQLYNTMSNSCRVYMLVGVAWIALSPAAVYKSAMKGAATSVNCAVNPALKSQQCFHYVNCQPVHTNTASRYIYTYLFTHAWQYCVHDLKRCFTHA